MWGKRKLLEALEQESGVKVCCGRIILVGCLVNGGGGGVVKETSLEATGVVSSEVSRSLGATAGFCLVVLMHHSMFLRVWEPAPLY